jgi:hypothetical protein
MGDFAKLNEKKLELDETMSRLESFDPEEVIKSLEFYDAAVPARIEQTVELAIQLFKDAKIQLENENFTILEYAVHKLRGMFTTIGCQRLAYLFESIYRNLNKVKIETLRLLFAAVSSELVSAQHAITKFIEHDALAVAG